MNQADSIPHAPATDPVRPRRIAVAGGGTAGHVYMAMAIADAYTQSYADVELLFISTPGGFAPRLVPRSSYQLVLVQGTPFFGVGRAGKLQALWHLCLGVREARQVFRQHGTQLVIGVGGYASASALLAARSLGLCTAIHEANTVLGLTNERLGRCVDRVYLGFATAGAAFAKGRRFVTGNPIRSDIVALGRTARRAPDGATRPLRILVTGGSLGAPFLNAHTPELLRRVAAYGLDLEVRHQGGDFDLSAVRQDYAHAGIQASVVAYIEDMASTYRWADLAIACSGAGTIGELAVCGLPALFVPLSQSAGDHQVANARVIGAAGGGWWIRESDWQVEALAVQIATLLRDPEAWMTASQRARQLATPNAAQAVVADCEVLRQRRWATAGSEVASSSLTFR